MLVPQGTLAVVLYGIHLLNLYHLTNLQYVLIVGLVTYKRFINVMFCSVCIIMILYSIWTPKHWFYQYFIAGRGIVQLVCHQLRMVGTQVRIPVGAWLGSSQRERKRLPTVCHIASISLTDWCIMIFYFKKKTKKKKTFQSSGNNVVLITKICHIQCLKCSANIKIYCYFIKPT